MAEQAGAEQNPGGGLASRPDEDVYPASGSAWYMVVLLTIAYVISFVDRNILSLLIEPIKADLQLSDTQIGLVLGPAFAIFYATIGLPLGLLADRKRRTWIVAAGIAMWSAATAFTAFARGFAQLFIARMAVGVGEAALSPCAMSLISDSFPEEKRGKPIALYSSAVSLGSGIASLLGAGVLIWANTTDTVVLPVLGELKPWQAAFFAVGVPGLILAVLFMLLPEPRRMGESANAVKSHLGHMLAHVGKNFGVYGSFVTLFCFMTIVAYSQGWMAVNFSRTFGWEASTYAWYNGWATLVVGPPAVLAAGWLSDRWSERGMVDAPLRVAVIGFFICAPTAAIGPLLGNPWVAFVVLACANIGFAFLSATGVNALLKIVPARIRAQTVALYYMAISMTGLMLGPTLVGVLNDSVFGVDGVRYSLAALPIAFGIPVLLLIPVTLRLYKKALTERLIDD